MAQMLVLMMKQIERNNSQKRLNNEEEGERERERKRKSSDASKIRIRRMVITNISARIRSFEFTVYECRIFNQN